MEDLGGWKALYRKLRKMAICFSIQVLPSISCTLIRPGQVMGRGGRGVVGYQYAQFFPHKIIIHLKIEKHVILKA